jgi:hypothetical protein
MAYLTRVALEQEATWWFTAWQPQIGSAAAFDAWIDTVVTRVGQHTRWRVGEAVYGTADPVAQAVLGEAELCLAQYYLCLASAAIADTSDDAAQVPALASGPKLLADGRAYKERYEEIVQALEGGTGRAGWAKARAAVGTGTGRQVPELEAPVDWERRG